MSSCGPSRASSERLLVLEVSTNNDMKMLKAVSPSSGDQIFVALSDEWAECSVETGHIVRVILTTPSGMYEPWSGQLINEQPIPVTRDRNLLIHHPDTLIPSTAVADSFMCLRRSVLSYRAPSGKLSDSTAGSEAALFGHLIHEMFQIILAKDANIRNSSIREVAVCRSEKLDIESFYEAAEETLYRHHEDMFAAGVSDRDARLVLHKVTTDVMTWYQEFMGGERGARPGVAVGEGRLTRNIFVPEVDDIEELIWSPVFGLKGKIDATIHLLVDGVDVGIGILELKTGKSSGYAALYHSAQVILYSLLLSDRKDRLVNHALITYITYQEALQAVQKDQSQASYTGDKIELLQTQTVFENKVKNRYIVASRAEVTGLVMQRNRLASYLRLESSIEDLPPLLQGKPEVCAKCFSNENCLIQHKLMESGTPRSVADGPGAALFEEKTSHVRQTHKEYYQLWSSVLAREQECAARQMKDIWSLDGMEGEMKGLCIACLKLQVSVGTGGKKQCIGLLSPGQLIEANFVRHTQAMSKLTGTSRPISCGQISKGDFVVVSAEHNLKSEIFRSGKQRADTWQCALTNGFVSAASETSITVAVDRSLEAWMLHQQLDPDDVAWRLDRREGYSPYFVARNALENMFASEKCSRMKRLRELVVELKPPEYMDEPKYVPVQQSRLESQDHAQMTLNQDQETAVRLSLRAKDYVLILGMPGTGKTTTLVSIILATALQGRSILFCSHTNSAVDNLLTKLLDLGFENFIRLGRNLDVIDRNIHPYHFSKAFTRDRPVSDLEQELEKYRVVATTCLGINHPLLCRRQNFDLVVIDEASQILQPICLGPLQFAKGPFILVGDHYQLPPLLISAKGKKYLRHYPGIEEGSRSDSSKILSPATTTSKEDCQQESLFRRLCEAHPTAVVALTKQYRMADEIMELANDLVYSGSLKCGSPEVNNQLLQLPDTPLSRRSFSWRAAVLNPIERVVFLTTKSDDMSDPPMMREKTRGNEHWHAMNEDSFGRVSESEANTVLMVLELLVGSGVDGADITVLSPFRAQVGLIKHLITSSGSHLQVDLTRTGVSTVDQYQGKDNNCVIVSFVRNGMNPIGPLLKDWRRTNVALTRAKNKLILIGSEATLRNGCNIFERMLKLLKQRGKVHDVRLAVPNESARGTRALPQRFQKQS